MYEEGVLNLGSEFQRWRLLTTRFSVTIPPSKALPVRTSERLIAVTELDTLCKGSFPVRPPPALLCRRISFFLFSGIFLAQQGPVDHFPHRLRNQRESLDLRYVLRA
jgi:hypothetical protein